MTMIKTAGIRAGMLPVAVLALLVTGCGTERGAGADRSASRTPVATPSTPVDSPCPGESSASAPAATTPSAVPPVDHYAENHGFMVPFPLHGKQRCEGLQAVGRVQKALEPLRKRRDFAPESTRAALTGLGYPAGQVSSYQNGSTGVGFLVDAFPLCVEGTMDFDSTKAEAFGGYPDHTGCDQPRGGH